MARADIRAIERKTAMQMLHCIDDYISKRIGGVKKLRSPLPGLPEGCGDYRVFFDHTGGSSIEITGVRDRKEADR